jgi:hypothetical protein
MNNVEIVTELHTPAPSYVIPFNADAVNETVWQDGVCTIRLAGPSREAARYVLFVDARIGTYKTLKSAVRRARIENGREVALTDDETACLAGMREHGKPVVVKSMSAAARIKVPGFRLGAAKSLAKKGLVTEGWDNARNGFVYTVVA